MIPLKEWLATDEFKRLQKIPRGELFTREFFREPLRPIRIDPDVMYSPADGVILYARTDVKPTDPIVEVKGKPFTVQTLLDDDSYQTPSLVIGIYMTQNDVHVNRIPSRGYLAEVHRTPFMHTYNCSMILEEEDIFDGEPQDKHLDYLFTNERRISRVYNPDLNQYYYIIQIAEKDVNRISNWGSGMMTQGEKFGQVRYGSQVDLVIPLTGKTKFEIVCKEKYHVEAGLDALVRVVK